MFSLTIHSCSFVSRFSDGTLSRMVALRWLNCNGGLSSSDGGIFVVMEGCSMSNHSFFECSTSLSHILVSLCAFRALEEVDY